MPFEAEVRKREAGAIVTLRGEIDLCYAPNLRRSLMPLYESVPLVIDLSELDFIDASGLRVLYAASQRAPFARFVRGRRGIVQKVFEITNLDQVLNFYDTRDQAWNAPIFEQNGR